MASTTATSDSKTTPHKPEEVHRRDKNSVRIAVINYRSVRFRKAELENLVHYTDPDILLLSETWLDPSINCSEFLPSNYKGDITKGQKWKRWGSYYCLKEHPLSCRGTDCTHLEFHWNSMGPRGTRKQQIYAHRGILPYPKWQVPRIGGRPWSYTGQLPSQLTNHRRRRLQRSRHQMEVAYSGPWLRPENTLRDTNQRIWRSPHETTRQGTHQGRKHPRPVRHQSPRISHFLSRPSQGSPTTTQWL